MLRCGGMLACVGNAMAVAVACRVRRVDAVASSQSSRLMFVTGQEGKKIEKLPEFAKFRRGSWKVRCQAGPTWATKQPRDTARDFVRQLQYQFASCLCSSMTQSALFPHCPRFNLFPHTSDERVLKPRSKLQARHPFVTMT